MNQSVITRRRLTVATVGLAVFAVALPLVTRRLESIVTVVLPAAVIYWMIARENRLFGENQKFSPVPWATKVLIFGLFPGASLAIILIWFPRYASAINVWGKYSIASFCLALVLVKAYERYLAVRRKGTSGVISR